MHKAKIDKLKEVNKSTVNVEDFNIYLLPIDRSTDKRSRYRSLQCHLNNICRLTAEYVFFTVACGIFTMINNILDKLNLHKCKRTKMPRIFLTRIELN